MNCRIAIAAALAIVALGDVALAQSGSFGPPMMASPYESLGPTTMSPYPMTSAPGAPTQWAGQPVGQATPVGGSGYPTSANWVVQGDGCQSPGTLEATVGADPSQWPQQQTWFDPANSQAWDWQVVPDGLIYRSYWAGVKEPRLGVTMFHNSDAGNFWDASVGGRVALLRYGDHNALHPQGWEFDAEGVAQPRLTLDGVRDLETVDFQGGALITYGISDWQFKFGYSHLSSHLGDEFAIANPGSLAERINYVRDEMVLGASYYVIPEMRLYAETAYAFNADGGAEPWEFQFGTELARSGPTGAAGTPFLAVNGHLREENNFSGDFTAQTGWLWRGTNGQVMRIGAHYFNGKSSQYQTFDNFEQQVGVGLWYDF